MCKLISVVVTTYGRDIALVKQAIESAFNQTYSNLEIILVDDNGVGSKLQMENQVEFANIPRLKYIANVHNSGAQVSRNIGILNANGEFIAFLDDDDYWDKTKLEKQLNVFEENIGLVYCNGYIIKGETGEIIREYQSIDSFKSEVQFKDLLYNDYIGTTTQAVVRKECFATCGLFDYEMPARQDYEMWLRISRYFKTIGVNEFLFYHRIHEGEQISKNIEKRFNGYYRIFKKYREDYKFEKKAKVKCLLRLSLLCKRRKCFGAMISFFVRAFIKNPLVTIMTIKDHNNRE